MARFALPAVLVACSGAAAPPPDLAWMAKLDDSASLAALSIPGTHESAALYEPLVAPGTAKCQTLTLAQQLDIGVRYFDIRCRDLSDKFAIFHGPIDELQTFDDVLATMTTFLAAHPSETVILSVKEESTPENTTQSFEATFRGYVAEAPSEWYLGAAVPTLGAVRGKLVLLRRFAAASVPLGIDASMWADNTTFTITDVDATLRIEDDYQVSDDAAKWSEITGLLGEARGQPTSPTLFLTYTSGYQLQGGIPNIPSVDRVINPMLDSYLADPGAAHAHLGVLALNMVNAPRAAAIAAANP